MSKFRLQCKAMLLTYKTHIDKKYYIDFVNEKFKKQGIKFVRLAHETGDTDCPYEHTHAVVVLEKRCDLQNERCLDFNDIHPHIKKLISEKAIKDAKIYIAKEDPENEDLKNLSKSFVETIMSAESLEDALIENCKKPSDAIGIIAIHKELKKETLDFRKRPKNIEEIKLRNWQEKLEERLLKTPDDRKIIWIWDQKGNMGKNFFSRYMVDKHGKKFISGTNPGVAKDAAHTILNELKKGWEAWGIFINLSRNTEEHKFIYETIEDIKDGCFTSSKYNGTMFQFDNPHVIIMSNWYPKVEALTIDRWEIYKPSDEEPYLNYIPVNRFD